LVYSGRLGAPGYYYSSLVAADNKVYIASEEGVVVVLDAGAELKVLATNKLDGAILATPAIASDSRREHIREDRKSLVRFWKLISKVPLQPTFDDFNQHRLMTMRRTEPSYEEIEKYSSLRD
jgi:PQQ-like domain